MNILLISSKTQESKGGIAIWTNHFLSGCKECGIDCELVNTATIGKRSTQLSAKRSFKDEYVRTRHILKDLNAKLKSSSFDVAHLNTSIGVFGIIRDYYIAKKIAKKKIPIVLHFHCDIPFWVKSRIIKIYLKKILKISSKNFVLCKNSQNYIKNNFDKDSEIVPNFIDERLIVDSKPINSELKNCIFVGRASNSKGAKEIFEIATRFPNISFKLVGEITDDVKAWNKPQNVFFLGTMSHEEVLCELDNADLFLFPSHTEGFSMALAESMARGLPAIASDVGANADMLESQGGIIFNAKDVDAIEAALSECADYDTRAKMSRWCINKTKNYYTTKKVLDLFLTHYRSI